MFWRHCAESSGAKFFASQTLSASLAKPTFPCLNILFQNFPKLEGRAPSRPMRQLGHDGACPSTARNFGDFSRNGEVLILFWRNGWKIDCLAASTSTTNEGLL
jgi:hypothetical protein